MSNPLPRLTAAEAASLINNGDTIAFSGFTPAGSPKAVPFALAERAKAIHAEGKPFKVGVVTGASTGKSLDGALAQADAISFRTPYQANADLRKSINAGKTRYFDMHLSVVAQNLRYGFLGKVQWAIVEACDVTPEGEIVVTSGVGIVPTACRLADKIIIELNSNHPKALRGFHDIYEPLDPPHRREIPVYKPSDRIGSATIKVDPSKIVGIVETNQPDETGGFDEPSEVTKQIGQNVADFLASEMKAGRIPAEFLPIQSGVGNIANAVLGAMGVHPGIPAFEMYTEVIQDAVIGLIRNGKVKFASGSSLTVSNEILQSIYADLEFFRSHILLRPQEISNNPEVVRRLGLITINTAIEADVFGNINSTHIMGKQLMNGIGGSGDFTRSAYLSIFTCPSIAKGGAISAIVPFASHLDHSEHSVSAIITEQGIADLRGKCPEERARLIIDKCAHPEYKAQLNAYIDAFPSSHTPQALSAAFAMHQQFLKTGDMRGVDWSQFLK
ncbi:MAG: acetyl-CoA hydrolase/transferase family protein [Verrucomicrobiota bacterium]